MITGFAPAKVNLTLHVTGQRADGYHLLDSLVVFASIGDRLWLREGAEMSLRVTGPFADGVPCDARNLIWQAAEAAGVRGEIHLKKNLPHGAGLGGGSADAAALLRSVFGDKVEDGIGLAAAARLGADVPVCLHAGPQRMRGIGEDLCRVWTVPRCDIVLVNPRVVVPTPVVFSALPQKVNAAMGEVPETTDFEAFIQWLSAQRNDLQDPAITLAPAIRDALAALADAALSRMSGSGATVFGLYPNPDAAEAARQRIAAEHPDWWVVAGNTMGAMA